MRVLFVSSASRRWWWLAAAAACNVKKKNNSHTFKHACGCAKIYFRGIRAFDRRGGGSCFGGGVPVDLACGNCLVVFVRCVVSEFLLKIVGSRYIVAANMI